MHGHRAFLAGSHRFEYLKVGATTLSFFLEGRNAGNASYTYAGDLNGDGSTANDLVYVPRDVYEMSFHGLHLWGQRVHGGGAGGRVERLRLAGRLSARA